MKITKSFLRQIIKECMADMGMQSGEFPVAIAKEIEPDKGKYDDEGRMAKSNLYKMAKYATQLHNMIQDSDNLEPWVEEKIAVAAESIKTIADYMEYESVRGSR